MTVFFIILRFFPSYNKANRIGGRSTVQKKYWIGLFTLACFLYLLFFPEDSLAAVRDGLSLWYRSVLPVLFPFLILSGIVTRLELTKQIPEKLLRPVCHAFGCSCQGCFAIVSGFLCGFPMGAKMTRDLQTSHLITGEEADFLYGFVNNVSPAFLMSFLALEQLHRPEYQAVFLFSVSGAAILYGLISRPQKGSFTQPSITPLSKSSCAGDTSRLFSVIDDCIQDGILAAIRLGAYITVFSLLSSAAENLLPDNILLQAAVAGLFEITNGCSAVAGLDLPLGLKVIWLCAVCAFGSLSAFAQTVSITSMGRASACRYIKSRVIITLLASALAFGILFFRRLSLF